MEDGELLERAAKAAGMEGYAYWPSDNCMRSSERATKYGPVHAYWSPLTDDGDALRLAVKLFLWEAVRDGYQHVDSDGDIYAATRRAIVRAAAALSEDHPK
jgi:hypothetical protein